MKTAHFGFIAALLVTTPSIAAEPPTHLISMERAKEIATHNSPGTVKSSELEFEKKQWVYSFDINGRHTKIHEVLVNAKTGKIVSSTIETAAKEASELKQDRK